MKSKEELTDLVNRIEKWAVNLGLNTNSNPLKQTLKYYEEVGELAKAIQRKDLLEVMDGIGDSVVVGAVMGSQLRGLATLPKYQDMPLVGLSNEYIPFIDVLNKTNVPKLFHLYTKNLQRYVNYCVDTYSQEEYGYYLFDFYGKFLQSANQLAICLGVDLNECVKMAYTTIYFRSGKIIDGVFVKCKPQATIRIPTTQLALPIDRIIDKVLECAEHNGFEFFNVRFDGTILNYSHK